MQVEALDHVHIEVTDRQVAAEWYHRVLGLVRHPGLAQWAEHPQGPLILAGADGTPTLSLFAGAKTDLSRDNTVAFRVSGAVFLEFISRLPELDLLDRFGDQVTAQKVQDHDLSRSIYFVDPDGNRLEVTTYDVEAVAAALDAAP